MFDSLADRMKQDDNNEVKKSEVILRWTAVAIMTVLVFGGLYFAVHLAQ